MVVSKKTKIIAVFISIMSVLSLVFVNAQLNTENQSIFLPHAKVIPLSEIPTQPSNTTILDNGTLIIPEGVSAYIDQNITVGTLIVNGKLYCNNTLSPDNLTIRASVIYVNGLLQCGTSTAPFTKKITFSLKPDNNVDPRQNAAYRAIIVNQGGSMVVHGSTRKSKWMRINTTVEPGQNTVELENSKYGNNAQWDIGDTIVVAPTSYNSTEAETFTITGINGRTLTLDHNFSYRHWGTIQTISKVYSSRTALDQRAEIANLTRNIVIKGDEVDGAISDSSTLTSEIGGHVMVMYGGQAYVDSVEFYKMGQAGIMARYPFHWHIVGNAPGQYIKNSSIHKSFQRCVTVHRTNQSSVINNVCYNFKGHGYFLEDGAEVDNTLSGNLGIMAKYPYANKTLLASDQLSGGETSGRFPNVSVFWISHPRNTIINNVAAGSVGTCMWMSFENEVKDFQGNVITRPVLENTKQFDNNVAHSCQVGFTWDGAPTGALTGNPNNAKDRALDFAYYKPATIPVFNNLTSYKNKLTGVYFRGHTAVYNGAMTADNGWHYWLAYNQIIKKSTIVGVSENMSDYDRTKLTSTGYTSRYMSKGIIQYDGPFEAQNVDFIGYPTQKVYKPNSPSVEMTPVPIGIVGGTERFINVTDKVSFNPSPIHRVHIQAYGTINDYGVHDSTIIRDLDGTLTNSLPGSSVVAYRSLGFNTNTGCQPGGDTYFSQVVCPPGHYESFFTIFGGTVSGSVWNQPYVVRRNDGAVSHPLENWNKVLNTPRSGGTKFNIANSNSVSYEIMLKNPNPSIWINSEKENLEIPIVKILGHGQGCYLTGDGVSAKSSYAALKASTTAAYFAQGNDLFVKLVPTKYMQFFTYENNPYSKATPRTSQNWFQLNCTNPPIPEVTGKVESVVSNSDKSVTIQGWACKSTTEEKVLVSISAAKLKGSEPVSPVLGGNLNQLGGTKLPASVSTDTLSGNLYIAKPVLLSTVTANITPDAQVSFNCSVPSTSGFRFSVTLSKQQANMYSGYRIIATAKESQSTTSTSIRNSGVFQIP